MFKTFVQKIYTIELISLTHFRSQLVIWEAICSNQVHMEIVWTSWPIGDSVAGIVSSSRNTDARKPFNNVGPWL